MMFITAVIFVLTLLVLVVSHELGHFLVAKRFGVKVLEFGFGIPPKLWSKVIGETKWSVNLLPVGGFVRLLGEDETDGEIRGDPRSFAVKPTWQRILIVGAGVTVNLLLAWVLFYTVLFLQNWRIIYPSLEPVVVISDVVSNMPASESGVRVGEKVISVDGIEAKTIDQVARIIKSKPELQVKLVLADIDGGNLRVVDLTPKKVEGDEGRIGVAFSPIPFKSYQGGLNRALSAPSYSWDLTRLTFQGLGKLINNLTTGNISQASESVAGPIGLVGVTNGFVQSGWQATIPYLWFVGVISLTLAIFNILPIPALDGGRILFMLVELIFRRKVNPKFEKWVHTFGMAVLLALMALVTISDIGKLI